MAKSQLSTRKSRLSLVETGHLLSLFNALLDAVLLLVHLPHFIYDVRLVCPSPGSTQVFFSLESADHRFAHPPVHSLVSLSLPVTL